MSDNDKTELFLNTKSVKRIVKQLDEIESYGFKTDDGEEILIQSSNISKNVLRMIAILILSSNGFYKDEELSLKRVGKKGLNSLVDNFDIVFEQLCLKVIQKLEIEEEKFVYSNLEKIASVFKTNLKSKILSFVDGPAEKDIFGDLFSFIFDKSENCGKLEEVIRSSLVEVGLKKDDSIGDDYFIMDKINDNCFTCYKYVGNSKRIYFCKLIDYMEYFPELKDLDPEKVYKKLMKLIDVSTKKRREEFMNRSVQIMKRREFTSISDCVIPIESVGYSSKCEKVYEIRRYSQYTLETYHPKDNRVFIKEFIEFITAVHSQGIVIGNISPSKILYEPGKDSNRFMIYDLSNSGVVFDTAYATKSGYDSLSLRKKKSKNLTFYDDAESFIYTCNYIITRNVLKFEGKDDELEMKKSTNLEEFLEISKTAIVKLRELEQNDENVSEAREKTDELKSIETHNFVLYGKSCYESGENNIGKVLKKFRKGIPDKTREELVLTPLQEALYKSQFEKLSTKEEYSEFSSSKLSELALKEAFKMIYGCEYNSVDENKLEFSDDD